MNEQTLFAELTSQMWFRFLLVALLGFLTGLELRGYNLGRLLEKPDRRRSAKFGTSRTYTFIAILGYVLVTLDPELRLYLAGMGGLFILFAVFYFQQVNAGQTSLLQLLIGLIVYSYGPVAALLPPWFLVMLFVSVVFTLNARPLAHRISEGIAPGELLTLSKFLLLSAVVLPLLPNTPVSQYIPASPFKIWVAVVVISSISYAGYLLKEYLLKQQGYLVTGVLGGIYSSTATTVVLAKKTREGDRLDRSLGAGIIAATGMMYLRLLLLVAFLNPSLLRSAAVPLLLFGLGSLGFAAVMGRRGGASATLAPEPEPEKANPLELGVALLFAVLFVVMMAVTQQVILHFGKSGLDLLSFGIGFTDIDPFVLSILNGQYHGVTDAQLAAAIVIASGSNDVLKGVYALVLGNRKVIAPVATSLFVLGIATIAYGLALSRGVLG